MITSATCCITKWLILRYALTKLTALKEKTTNHRQTTQAPNRSVAVKTRHLLRNNKKAQVLLFK